MSGAPVLRIGVTGHRVVTLAPIMLTRLQDAIRGALAALMHCAAEIHERQRGAGGDRHVLQVVSALAEGADRMVAAAGLALDAELIAMLPFSSAQYMLDFPDQPSKQEFTTFLSRATEVVELDGRTDTDDNRNAGYEAVGRAVVERTDLMFALWDGEPAQGRGGTAEIVDYARRRGRPVLWFKVGRGGATLSPSLLLGERTIEGEAVEALIAHLRGRRA